MNEQEQKPEDRRCWACVNTNFDKCGYCRRGWKTESTNYPREVKTVRQFIQEEENGN